MHAHPRNVRKCIESVPPRPPYDYNEEWKKAGGPVGLPWKVYKAWKEGTMCIASPEEEATKDHPHTLSDARNKEIKTLCLSAHVYQAWRKGKIFKPTLSICP